MIARSRADDASRQRHTENVDHESLVRKFHEVSFIYGAGSRASLGGLLVDARCTAVTGRYFDGFKEMPSSLESRNEARAAPYGSRLPG